MKILVAGGAGYIGSLLTPYLIKKGYQTDVIDLLWFGNFLPKNIKVMKDNVIHLSRKELKKYDTVIFLAGLSNDPMAEYNPSKNFIYNSSLPAYLAFEAKKAGVRRFIYASSCSVYGNTCGKLVNEKSETKTDYPYGLSKLQGEYAVHMLQDRDFSVISLRQGTVCGYSPRMRFDLAINTMYKTAVLEGKIIVNNPKIWRPICFTKDILDLYLKAIRVKKSISGIFNIASGNYTVLDMAMLCKKKLEKLLEKKIKLVIKNIPDKRDYKVSIKKAKKILGFTPFADISTVVTDLYNNNDKYKDLEDKKYYNIRVFQKINI